MPVRLLRRLGFAHSRLFASFPPYRIAVFAAPPAIILAALGFWAAPARFTIPHPYGGQPAGQPSNQLSGDYALCYNASSDMPQDAARLALAACARVLGGTAGGTGSLLPQQSYFGQAAANMALGNSADAVASFTQVIAHDPNNDRAYYQRANLQITLGNDQAGIDDAAKALSLAPGNADDLAVKARGELAEADYAAAITDSNAAIQAKPDHAFAHLMRGEAEAKSGDANDAAQDISSYLQTFPGSREAEYWRGYAEARIPGHAGAATADLQAAAQDSAFTAFSDDQLALLAFKQQDWLTAMNDETQALSLNPHIASALTTRSGAEIRLNRYSAAQADARAALALNPGGPLEAAALENLGLADDGNGDYADAATAFSQALQLVPGNPKIAAMLADARQHAPN